MLVFMNIHYMPILKLQFVVFFVMYVCINSYYYNSYILRSRNHVHVYAINLK